VLQLTSRSKTRARRSHELLQVFQTHALLYTQRNCARVLLQIRMILSDHDLHLASSRHLPSSCMCLWYEINLLIYFYFTKVHEVALLINIVFMMLICLPDFTVDVAPRFVLRANRSLVGFLHNNELRYRSLSHNVE
jgi:hypothetical protein